MKDISDLITGALVSLFSAPGSALAIAFMMLVTCSGILIGVRWSRVKPCQEAVEERIWLLGGGGVLAPPTRLADHDAMTVEQVMERSSPSTRHLARAWEAYRRTRRMIGGRLRATSSASPFFTDLPTGTNVLGWWATIFVAIGLVFTFLGVVAALTAATATIGDAADPATTQAALADLLRITATKFWTSIAGVGSSIVLRVFERRWRSALENGYAKLSDQLDRSAEPVDTGELLARQADLLELIAVRIEPSPAYPQTVG